MFIHTNKQTVQPQTANRIFMTKTSNFESSIVMHIQMQLTHLLSSEDMQREASRI